MADGLRISRRGFLVRAAALSAGAIAAPVSSSAAPAAEPGQPAVPRPRGFAERAAEMRRRAIARGDQPYGAVVVKDGRVVGEGVSAVVVDEDPTAHAEMLAIRDAARRLRTRDLSGCELYGTSRACPMCEAAAAWARIARMFHGDPPVDAGAPRLR
jgi:tRNA(Arg) A34 adenosine deaminase TadA